MNQRKKKWERSEAYGYGIRFDDSRELTVRIELHGAFEPYETQCLRQAINGDRILEYWEARDIYKAASPPKIGPPEADTSTDNYEGRRVRKSKALFCKWCGIPMVGAVRQKKFCSDACRKRFERHQKLESTPQ